MDINFCWRCGSPVAPGTDRCPKCGAFYDEREKYSQNNYQQYYNNQIPRPQSKSSINTIIIVIVVIFAVLFILGILAAIFIPALIGYTAKQHQYKTARMESEYSYSDEYEPSKNNYSEKSGIKALEDMNSITEFNEAQFDGTYSDDEGEYKKYVYSNMTFDVYTNSETENIEKVKFSLDSGTSSWIKENDLYDSILKNNIASIIEICDYSWGDAQDYLDGFSLADGMDETDENGYYFFLDVDSPEITFTVTMPE